MARPKKIIEENKEYTATANVLGKEYTSKGKTIRDTISKLKVGVAKGKVILTISNGKNSKERVLNVFQVNKLFNTSGFTQEVALKNISLLFEGL